MGSALIKSADIIKRVGVYVLTKELGTGVMGESFQCYKVLQPKDEDFVVLDKPFCIKILGVEFAQNAAYRQLFARFLLLLFFCTRFLVMVLNRKPVAKCEDLSVRYHPLKMLFTYRPFGEHVLC